MTDDNVTDLDAVRATLKSAETVAPVDGLAPPSIEDDGPSPRTPDDGLSIDDNVPPPRTPNDDGPSPQDDPVDPIAEAARQPLNDYGNGQRFVIHFGIDVMWVPRVGWFDWDGMVWQKDPDELKVRRKSQQLAYLIGKETEVLTLPAWEMEVLGERDHLGAEWERMSSIPMPDRTPEQKAELGRIKGRLDMANSLSEKLKKFHDRRRTHAKNAGNSGPLKNLLHESTTDLAVPFEDLDSKALDVNTQSGLLRFRLVDMSEDGGGKVAEYTLIDHAREQLLTKMMPVNFDMDADAPLFTAFLERVQPNRDMRMFLQRWIGLSMTGIKSQKLAFFYGSGANGKSVLVDLMGRIMAGYAASMKIESLTGSNKRTGAEATPDLIPLLGARFVRTSEPDVNERLQESLIKQLTGGEPIPVRPNYGDQIDMDPVFKLTMSGNHKPDIRGTDDGIWRRVMLVPFDVQIPESERDDTLGEKLWAERDGIFAWMVKGLMDYLEGGLQIPDSVADATKEYREESDPIGAFLTSCCVITGIHTDKILSRDLGEAFNYYLMEGGQTTWKPTTFAKQVASKAKHWKHPETTKQFVKAKASLSQYTGLKFTDAFGRRWDSAPKDSNGRAIGVAKDTAPDPVLDDFRE